MAIRQGAPSPARLLGHRYTLVMAAGVMLFASILGGLYYDAYQQLVDRELLAIESNLGERALHLSAVVRSADSYVQIMRQWAEQRLASGMPIGGHPKLLTDHLYYDPAKAGATLDRLPATLRPSSGSLWVEGPVRPDDSDQTSAIAVAAGLFAINRAVHQVNPFYGWSYFASVDGVIGVYPWFADQAAIEGTGESTVRGVFDVAIRRRPHWQMALPAANAQRKSFWTPAYVDDAGNGIDVTHGMPVYVGSTFKGMVATDLTVKFLSQVVGHVGYPGARLLVINEQDQVLADSQGLSDTHVTMADQVLSEPVLKKIRRQSDRQPGQVRAVQVAGQYLLIRPISNAPWRLVMLVPAQVLHAQFRTTILSYLGILLAVVVLLALGLWLVQHQFVRPAVLLADYIDHQITGQTIDIPRVDGPWSDYLQHVHDSLALRGVTMNLPGAVVQWHRRMDNVYQFDYVSDGLSRLLGYDAHQLLLRSMGVTDIVTVASVGALKAALASSESQMAGLDFECQLDGYAGRDRWVRIVARPRQTRHQVVYWDGLILDVTDRVLAECENQQLAEELRHAQKMEALGSVAGGMTHDVNNFVTAIIGYASQLKSVIADDARACKSVAMIEQAAERISGITRSLRLFARRESLIHEPLQVNELIDHGIDLMRTMIGNDVHLQVDLPAQPLWVSGDATHLQQVLMNLVLNSCDAMPHGGQLQVTLQLAPDDDQQILLSVADTGLGIHPDDLPRIFDPFFTTKPRGVGTGLGLSVSRGIIEDHDGQMTAESTPGKGTCVTVRLSRIAESRINASAQLPQDLTGHHQLVLLAEDDAMVRSLIGSQLKESNYRVLEASDGIQAWQLWQQQSENIALVIMDVQMPERTGLAVARDIRRHGSHVPILLITGGDIDLDEQPIDFQILSKPFAPHQLIERIAGMLDRANTAE